MGCPYSRILSLCDWLVVCVAISENLDFFFFLRDALDEFDNGGHQPLTLGPTGGAFSRSMESPNAVCDEFKVADNFALLVSPPFPPWLIGQQCGKLCSGFIS